MTYNSSTREFGSAHHKPRFTLADIGAILGLSFPLLRYSSFPELRTIEGSSAEVWDSGARPHKLPPMIRLAIIFGLATVAWAIVILPFVSIF